MFDVYMDKYNGTNEWHHGPIDLSNKPAFLRRVISCHRDLFNGNILFFLLHSGKADLSGLPGTLALFLSLYMWEITPEFVFE